MKLKKLARHRCVGDSNRSLYLWLVVGVMSFRGKIWLVVIAFCLVSWYFIGPFIYNLIKGIFA